MIDDPRPANLAQAVIAECNPCRELLKLYDELGPVGAFGAAMIRSAITAAETALGNGDIYTLLRAYHDLQGFKE